MASGPAAVEHPFVGDPPALRASELNPARRELLGVLDDCGEFEPGDVAEHRVRRAGDRGEGVGEGRVPEEQFGLPGECHGDAQPGGPRLEHLVVGHGGVGEQRGGHGHGLLGDRRQRRHGG